MSPGDGAAEIIEIFEARFPLLGEKDVDQAWDALFDAQPPRRV